MTPDAAPSSRPSTRRWRPLRRIGLVVFAVVAVAFAANEIWHALDRADEKRTLAGVGNFGQLSPYLYRGAQPTHAGFVALKALGIDTIVRVSTEKGQEQERADVEAIGLHFVALPWSSLHTPTRDEVAAFFALVNARPRRVIFVHCKAGTDRTGVMVALYRIAIDRWPVADAISEMKAFHYRYYLLPHLETYVAAFPARLAADPGLQAVAAGTDSSADADTEN